MQGNTTRRIRTALVSGLLVLALLGGTILPWAGPAPVPALAQPVAVGLVTDEGTLADMAFNWLSYQGLLRAEDELGVVGTVYTSTTSADYEPNLQQCVDDGNDLCISVGFLTADAIWNVAQNNPGVDFAIVDSSWDNYPTNLRGMTFAVEEGAYLAGTLAGLMSQSGILGDIGGMPIPPVDDFVYGFRNGAQCANLTATVVITYTWDFSNPDLGAQYAQALIGQGADVIFAPAGGTGVGAVLTATQSGVWGIGVDTDYYITVFMSGTVPGSDRLLTSAAKRLDNGVFYTIEDVVYGRFSPGTVRYDLAAGGVGIAPFHEADPYIPQEVRDVLAQVEQGIVSGTINVNDPCRTSARYVNGAAGSDDSDCTGPAAPCQSISYALSQAGDTDTILVAQGTYTENLWVDKWVTLEGGYEAISWTRSVTQYQTIIRSATSTIAGEWDGVAVRKAGVIHDGAEFKMWYDGESLLGGVQVGLATSGDGVSWTKYVDNPVMTTTTGPWDGGSSERAPFVLKEGGTYKMWYEGSDGGVRQLGYATSTDGIDWHPYVGNPVLQAGPEAYDQEVAGHGSVMNDGGTYVLWYHAAGDQGAIVAYATSPDGIGWTKQGPVLHPEPGSWDGGGLWGPSVLNLDGTYWMWYAAVGSQGPPAIGVVTSTDGISWTRFLSSPVLTETDPIGDPHVITEGGRLRMWYSVYPQGSIHYAESADGIVWTRSLSNPVLMPGTPGQWGQPVVTFAEGSDGVLLDGLTITGGDGDAGAGLRIANGGSALAANCVITANYAAHWGGGVWVTDAEAIIRDSVIAGNQSGGAPGIEVNHDWGPAHLTLESCQVHDNAGQGEGGGLLVWGENASADVQATTFASNSAGRGGGLCVSNGAAVTVSDSLFMGNTALDHYGGGVRAEEGATLSISGSTLRDNWAPAGGGVAAETGSTVTLVRTDVLNNSASSGGGGIGLWRQSTVTATDCLISGNEVGSLGGGIHVSDTDPVLAIYLTNCLIVGNRASDGGAGLDNWGRAVLMNVTLADNVCLNGCVGGLFNQWNSSAATVTNSILWGNDNGDVAGQGAITIYYSDIGTTTVPVTGTGNISDNPMFVDAAGGDYHLSAGSSCIDTGTNAGAPDHDYDGDARPFAGVVDMGADEWWPTIDVALAPTSASGAGTPGMTVVYAFTVTNAGEHTDTFSLSASGVWTPTLSIDTSGPLGPGAWLTFTLVISIPWGASEGMTDTAILTASSTLKPSATATARVVTTATQAAFTIYLPVVMKNH